MVGTVLHTPKYTRQIASILVPVLTVLAVPTDEILAVLAVPAAQNPEILGSAGSIRSTGPRNTASSKYPQYSYKTSKYCESLW